MFNFALFEASAQSLFSNAGSTVLNGEQTQRFQQIAQSAQYALSELVQVGALSGSINANGNLQINLDTALFETECPELEFRPKASRFIDGQNYYYYGGLVNEDTTDCLCFDGEIMLEASGGRHYGYFTIGESRYEISAIDNSYSVISKIDTSYLDGVQECLADSLSGSGLSQEATAQGRTEACTIRVLFLYSDEAETEYGVDKIMDMTSLGISQTNQAFANSKISDVQVSRANVRKWEGFSENPDNIVSDIEELQTSNIVAGWRSEDLADVVCLITHTGTGGYNTGNGTLGGLSGIWPDPNNAGQFITNLGNPMADLAFILVEDFSFNTNMTFSHELGHVIGCRHQACITYQTNNCDDGGEIEHGHGWGERPGWLCSWRNYSTILHELRHKNTRLLQYSNPEVLHNGHPTGVTGVSDNARWISDGHGCTVAGYLAEPIIPLSANIWGEEYLCQPYTGQYFVDVAGSNTPFSYEWHASTDGANWGSILSTSSMLVVHASNYPANQTVFLRVKVTDASGATTFAFFNLEIRPSGSGCFKFMEQRPVRNSSASVSPNPVGNSLCITFLVNSERSKVSFQAYSVAGSKLMEFDREVSAGVYSEDIPADQLPAGPVFIRLWDGQAMHQQLIIKH